MVLLSGNERLAVLAKGLSPRQDRFSFFGGQAQTFVGARPGVNFVCSLGNWAPLLVLSIEASPAPGTRHVCILWALQLCQGWAVTVGSLPKRKRGIPTKNKSQEREVNFAKNEKET